MTSLPSAWRLTVVVAGEERFQPPEDLSMYDWLSYLRLKLNDVNAESFVLLRVKVISNVVCQS